MESRTTQAFIWLSKSTLTARKLTGTDAGILSINKSYVTLNTCLVSRTFSAKGNASLTLVFIEEMAFCTAQASRHII